MEIVKTTMQNLKNTDNWNVAVIVFKQESFDKEYSEIQRSYKFSRDNKWFKPMLSGNSLFGHCLDGTDDNVRLDVYMRLLENEGKRWKEDYCYIVE